MRGASRPRSGSNRRWSWPTAGCINSVARCSITSIDCRSRSATHWGRSSASGQAKRPTASWSACNADLAGGRRGQQPLLCVIDDAQWLDAASAQIVLFVARRLLAERIALVCAARTGIGDGVLAGLPALPVAGLGDSDARALLLENVHGPLDAAVCDQIIAESHGNPLALLELPRTWNTAELAGGFGIPARQPVGSKIEQSFASVSGCSRPRRSCSSSPPRRSRWAIRFCCTAPPRSRPRSGRVRPCAGRGAARRRADASSSHTPSSAQPPIAPRQPMTVSVCTAPSRKPPTRSGTLTGAPGIAPRAAPAPDEDVAAELERSAGRAQARGGLAAAAAFLERASALSPDPAKRARRALRAAEAKQLAGRLSGLGLARRRA